MSQLKKGALLSYITIFLTTIIGLVLTPYIIRGLGDSEYGLYTLMGALVAQIAILNLGLNNAVIRFVSKYRVEKNTVAERNFLGTVMLIYLAISLVVLLIGGIIYLNINELFGQSLTPDELERAKPLLVLLIFNLAITLPGGTFDAISNAYERFVFTRGLNIIKYVSRAILIFALLMQYKSALFLVVLDTIMNIVVIIITMYFVFKKLKVSFSFKTFNSKLIKEVFSYSIWIFLFAISYRLQWFSGQTILGLTTNTVTVAIFGVGVLLGGYYGAFAGAINTLLLPRATKMSVQNDNAESYTYEMIRVGKVNVFILFLILSGFLVFGKAFIKLWVGDTYTEAWWVALLIMIALTLPLIQSFGNSVLEAKKKNRFKSMVNLITLPIAAFVGFFLSKNYGMNGMIYPLAVAMIINSFIMNFYYQKIFGFKIARFFKEVLFRQTLMILILTGIGIYFINKFVLYTWWDLARGVSIFSIVYLVINYLFVLDKETKTLISRFRR
jgi:O-antigen/teichoic acid export membrane protein